MDYSFYAPNDAITPKVSRDLVRLILNSAGLGDLADTAALLTSEVVTNVYLHCRSTEEAGLRLTLTPPSLRVSVFDRSPAPARLRSPARDEQNGRGLLLVDALAARWGATESGIPALKVVWFELDA